MNFLEMLALIPLFPAAGALVNGLLGRRCSKACISTVACGAVGISFLLSLGAFYQLLGRPEGQRLVEQELFTWISAGAGELSSGAISQFLVQWAINWIRCRP